MLSSRATPECESELPLPADSGTAGLRSRPRIQVLLATRNGSPWIREQMESLLAQDGVEIRVVIRDDCSTDGTRLELGRFAEDDRVSVSSATAPSGSAAQNFLILMAENPADRCDFVAFADQDDHWNPDKLLVASRMLARSGAAGYSSATLATWEDGRQNVLELSGAPTRADYLFEGAGQGCTFVLTAAFYERVRRFLTAHRDLTSQVHYHDWLVYALARAWGLQWCFDRQPSMLYRQHATNDTGARGTVDGILRRLTRIRQGWYRTQLKAIAASCAAAAPDNGIVRSWCQQFLRPDGWRRRGQLAYFCLGGGRRRTRDNLMLVFAALRGWI